MDAPHVVADDLRTTYLELEAEVQSVSWDSSVLTNIMGHLHDLSRAVEESRVLFSAQEYSAITTNILVLQSRVQEMMDYASEAQNAHRPIVIEVIRTGRRGRPRIVLDPNFLSWARRHRGQRKIARALGVSRTHVRTAMDNAGLLDLPMGQPLPSTSQISGGSTEAMPENDDQEAANEDEDEDEDVRDGDPLGLGMPYIGDTHGPSLTTAQHHLDLRPLSSFGERGFWEDSELDQCVVALLHRFPNAGYRALRAYIDRLYHVEVPYERIRLSLQRVDPERRVFQRRRLQRRKYRVGGPNSLWHHDGQHGLIHWGIVLHGFIDGFSRLVTGLRASTNNKADTVLHVFLDATRKYGVPHRVRGDHGTENVRVAAWMVANYGTLRRAPYIWGRSVHNIRIERLWVDVTMGFGGKWRELFVYLENECSLRIDFREHKWLLQYLFIPLINRDADDWVAMWNAHKIRMDDAGQQSPEEMWGFGMLGNGLRGEPMRDGEFEETVENWDDYGVDWAAMQTRRIRESHDSNNPADPPRPSWIGHSGPPPNLSEVLVDDPAAPLTIAEQQALFGYLESSGLYSDSGTSTGLKNIWTHALAFCRVNHFSGFE